MFRPRIARSAPSSPAHPRAAISRRSLGAATATAVLALVAACGGSDTATTPQSSGSSAAAATFPVSIEHKFGTTEVTKAPQRIVVVGLTEQDPLLALGVVPVATTKWFGENPGEIFPWAKDELGSAALPQVLTNTDGLQFEKIAALRPDLIVGMYSDLTKESYTTLTKIAPTLAQPKGVGDYGAAWDDVTRTLGKAVGKPAEAEKLIAGVDARFADVIAKNPGFKGAGALMAMPYEGSFVYGPQDPRSRLLTSLGFTLPADLATVTGDKFGVSISKERTDLLDTDVLIWLVNDYAKDKATVQANPLYAALKVKQEGREVFLADGEPLYNATSFISVLSIPYLLDGLVPQLTAALDGNPATPVVRSTLAP
jgi:ABC-type Fe3+-hydroxamate transport system substrate-binding protein